MATKYGFSALNDSLSNSSGDSLSKELQDLKDKFIPARVKNIILDENSQNFEELGGWTSVGNIEFELVDYQTPGAVSQGVAAPMFSSTKQYPLAEEIVFLVKLPSENLGVHSDSTKYYYLPPLSIWNHPHQNANPNQVQDSQSPDSQNKSTSQISAGATSKSGNSEKDLDFNGQSGGTFEEKGNIHPVLPFTGDVIVEGRYGNSIRLGNTSKTTSEYKNNWSEEGENGSPITIIKNGQPDEVSDEGWLPCTEDINTDKSSLYLTSTQKIPVTTVENYEAFAEPPEAPTEHIGNQAILNSGRLILNANLDSVLISGMKSIALSANEDIGISSNGNVVLTGASVKLGDKEADHPVILGDDFLDQFANLVDGLDTVVRYLAQAQIFPGGAAAPWLPMVAAATSFRASLKAIKGQLGSDPPGSRKNSPLLSKVTNTA